MSFTLSAPGCMLEAEKCGGPPRAAEGYLSRTVLADCMASQVISHCVAEQVWVG